MDSHYENPLNGMVYCVEACCSIFDPSISFVCYVAVISRYQYRAHYTNSIYGSAELSTPNSFKKWPIMGQAKQYGGNQSTNIKI